ncbi:MULTISPECIES: EAL domain-containing protein [unclassified Pseudomonas]|uniref:EAL domain-containing protein n=1 Tax=unclassified Pseudomonas TaxID=196821 RepID=UPI002113A4CE|nr:MULTISPECIES: EAL domain-containing protein [unclassified Pseudomonas]
MRESGLPPASLILEITESQLMHDDLDTLACLNELASLGVLLALDDFGTVYSSFGYLTSFALHILKLDKRFIGSIPYDNKQSAISQAIIGLGRSLGLEVVAEASRAQHNSTWWSVKVATTPKATGLAGHDLPDATVVQWRRLFRAALVPIAISTVGTQRLSISSGGIQ